MAGHSIVPKCAAAGNAPGRKSKPSRCRVSPRKADLKIDTHKKGPDMAIISVFYAAFGYLALLGAILWGMLFVADGAIFPNMDAAGTAAPLEAACVDVGLLLLLALLHRSVSRGMLRHFARRLMPRGLERSTQAWAGSPSARGDLRRLATPPAGAVVRTGAPSVAPNDAEHAQPTWKAPFTDMLRQPLYWGILMAVWATTVMTAGHMLLAAAVPAYMLFDALWAARKTEAAQESRRALSLQRERVAG